MYQIAPAEPEPPPAKDHTWQFYLSPHEAWDAMYEDCEKAAQSIEMEQYIFENDAVGQRFMDLFIRKAAEGLKVTIMCDKFGSASFENSPQIQKLREKGGDFYFYNVVYRWDIFRPWRWFPRTHIKAMLIDSKIGYLGSACFAERMTFWRDTQVRITGPVTEQIRKAFGRAEAIIKREKHERRPPVERSFGDFTYLQSYPLISWNIIYAELVRAIGQAGKYIYIATPFFGPNRRFQNLLRFAARTGIDVRLMVPKCSDVRLADWIILSYARRFLEAGCRIFRYDGFLHTKTVVIDDVWATVGSTNMDVLSFFRNREANLVIKKPEAIAALKQQFTDDLERCIELTPEVLAHEPAWKFVLGYFGRFVKSFFWRK